MASIPSNGYAEVMAGTNNYSGSNSYDASCPRTPVAPVIGNDLTNKTYVDAATGGGIVGTLTDKGSLLTGDGTQPVIFDQNPYQTALTTTTVYDWNSLAIGQSRNFTTTVPTLIPLGAGITITYSGTDSIKGNVTAVAGTTITITITNLASAVYTPTTLLTTLPSISVFVIGAGNTNLAVTPAITTPNPPNIPANTIITQGVANIYRLFTPTNFFITLSGTNVVRGQSNTQSAPATTSSAILFDGANGGCFFGSTQTPVITVNLTVLGQVGQAAGSVPPDFVGSLDGYTLSYGTGSIVIDDDIALIADALSPTGLAWGVINPASIGAVTSVSGGTSIVMSGTVPAPIVNLNITNTNTNATYYPTFVAGVGTQALLADTTTGPISLNPSNGNFNVVNTLKLTQTSLAVGKNAGLTSQSAVGAVAVGEGAGETGQGQDGVAVGPYAGNSNQSQYAVAVGSDAGNISQGDYSVAVGTQAGNSNQGDYGIAIGFSAGFTSQGLNSVAIGKDAGTTSQTANAVAIGELAGTNAQGGSAVAIGHNAGRGLTSGQGTSAVAIGHNSARTSQGLRSVAIGLNAGDATQGEDCVAIGYLAGQTTQGNYCVAIGEEAGQTSQEVDCIAIGRRSGETSQRAGSVALGYQAGQLNQTRDSIAIGTNAGNTSQGQVCIALGYQAGQTNQSIGAIALGYEAQNSSCVRDAIAIGTFAGRNTQGQDAIGIGNEAGRGITTGQGTNSIAIGKGAAKNAQGTNAVAIGNNAATNQGQNSIAIGFEAGNTTQNNFCIAMGNNAGRNTQGLGSIAIGGGAGQTSQSSNSIAIGGEAGQTSQGQTAVAIGKGAGTTSQGQNCVAIGNLAGQTNQVAGSIAINASGIALNPGQAGFYVRSIRGFALGLGVGVMKYDAPNFEIQYSTN